jgi:hypothetical protein
LLLVLFRDTVISCKHFMSIASMYSFSAMCNRKSSSLFL